ncbi:MAG TPA: general secretion pathway protein GspB [Wenzhouxiangella sp.]
MGRRAPRPVLWGLAGLVAASLIGAGLFWVNFGSVDLSGSGMPSPSAAIDEQATMPEAEGPAIQTAQAGSMSETVGPDPAPTPVAANEPPISPRADTSNDGPEPSGQEKSVLPTPDPISVETLEARLVATTQAPNPEDVVSDPENTLESVASEADVSQTDPSGEVSEPWRPQAADYLYQWELPLSVRQSLPPLNLLVHVYSEKPQERFVLINGTRFREGDELSPGVRLAEIRPQGALVDFRDYRFLLTQ